MIKKKLTSSDIGAPHTDTHYYFLKPVYIVFVHITAINIYD